MCREGIEKSYRRQQEDYNWYLQRLTGTPLVHLIAVGVISHVLPKWSEGTGGYRWYSITCVSNIPFFIVRSCIILIAAWWWLVITFIYQQFTSIMIDHSNSKFLIERFLPDGVIVCCFKLSKLSLLRFIPVASGGSQFSLIAFEMIPSKPRPQSISIKFNLD